MCLRFLTRFLIRFFIRYLERFLIRYLVRLLVTLLDFVDIMYDEDRNEREGKKTSCI